MKGTLMVSISGIRGIFGHGLDPVVLARYTSAFGTWCARRAREAGRTPLVIVGRDARVTGPLCSSLVEATLQATGCTVIDAGLATTPTVEVAVIEERAAGGIVLSASHNPAEWNALKLLNEKGEFLSPEEGQEVIAIADASAYAFASWDQLGTRRSKDFLDRHIERILELDFIHPEVIRKRDFKVVVDGINSVGSIAIPALLDRLGVRGEQVLCLNCVPDGRFAHIAEPLPENLTETMAYVREVGADIGIVVDPDADRLALVDGNGHYVSEELTQVLAADFMWRFRSGPFVTNLSSSRAIEDVAERYGQQVYRSAVGEINVVKRMQEVGAMLGGEGNGGIILPDIHYGRDGLIGTAMILQHLANERISLADWKATMPVYTIVKRKAELGRLQPDVVLQRMAEKYRNERISTVDGLKIDFSEGWVHLRKSNTEPIIRIYSEAKSEQEALETADRFSNELVES